jgi:hypothetical protein
MTRPITRALLASAIEYAAQSKLKPWESLRYFVDKGTGSHRYPDEMMERARVETVRLLHSHTRGSIPHDVQKRLYELAAELRANGKT